MDFGLQYIKLKAMHLLGIADCSSNRGVEFLTFICAMNRKKMMKILSTAFIPLLLVACAGTDMKESSTSISSKVLLESTTSWDGGNFAYPEGDPQLTITRINIPKGVSLPMHCHPVPLGGVLTKGVLEVTKESGGILILSKDEALIEVSMQWHYGKALEEVEILVVYSGAKGLPVTVLKNGDPKLVAQCY
ncbi:MAG: quercetin dioxygenase-like cupin family protein [Lysobacterales bacterium]|jgi:quercetin dioxygenase-like cupin family protein